MCTVSPKSKESRAFLFIDLSNQNNMTHTLNTETYILPAYWASALINDDYTGLEESDIEAIEAFLFANKEQIGSCIDVSEDSWFAHSNDAINLGCDVATFTFLLP